MSLDNFVNFEGFTVSDIDNDGTPNYYGFVDRQGRWYIMEETLSAGADTYRYASGDNAYPAAWTGRAGITYAYFNGMF
jgi:hypothetical protein